MENYTFNESAFSFDIKHDSVVNCRKKGRWENGDRKNNYVNEGDWWSESQYQITYRVRLICPHIYNKTFVWKTTGVKKSLRLWDSSLKGRSLKFQKQSPFYVLSLITMTRKAKTSWYSDKWQTQIGKLILVDCKRKMHAKY